MLARPEVKLRSFLPSELRDDLPRCDFHLHTNFTDGEPAIEEYSARAIDLGLTEIGFPEHCNLSTTWLGSFVPTIEAARERYAGRLSIVWGIEAKALDYDGTLAATEEMRSAAEYVYGAFHSSMTSVKFTALDSDQAIEMEYCVTLGMIRAGSCDAIAHPSGLSLKYHGGFPDTLLEDLAREAAAHDTALEINPGYGADIASHLTICERYECRIVLGSNAHKLDELGMIVARLERLGLG